MTSSNMKVSIVTPVHNDVRVARALDSILSQRHDAELELIVVDGGSTDGTPDVLARYRDRLAVLLSEPDDDEQENCTDNGRCYRNIERR